MKTSTPLAPADLANAIQVSGSKGHFKRNAILGLIVIAVGLGGWFWRSRIEKAKQQVPLYVTEPLTRGDVFLSITATGNLEPTNEVTVGNELSGITLEVNADVNDRVTKGQQIAKLDTSKLLQQTESNRAAVRAAQARVTLAEATVKESAALLTRSRNCSASAAAKCPPKPSSTPPSPLPIVQRPICSTRRPESALPRPRCASTRTTSAAPSSNHPSAVAAAAVCARVYLSEVQPAGADECAGECGTSVAVSRHVAEGSA